MTDNHTEHKTSEVLLAGTEDHSPLVPWKTFLESVPPGKETLVDGMASSNKFSTPELYLYCPTESCAGYRFFAHVGEAPYFTGEGRDVYLVYVCRNCRQHIKRFSIHGEIHKEKMKYQAFKFGESPGFGPPTPARTISLIGPDRDLFLMGRRCENQGLGIGAFVYYRRVVENQKNRIFDEIIRVVSKIAPDPELTKELESAKKETQFSKAIDLVRHGIPQSLLINGHNPLALLHSALSEGLHAQTDTECLELASSIRIVLNEFSERASQALKDEQELNSAVSRLMNSKKLDPG